MRVPRPRVRTLLILVAAVALLFELAGLGGRMRHRMSAAREAARAERVHLAAASNSILAASQCLEEAGRVEPTDPAKAAELRARADRLRAVAPILRAQARRAGLMRSSFEESVRRPWEEAPTDAGGLATTPPVP